MRISTLQHLKQQLAQQISDSQRFVDVLERIYNKTRGQRNTVALITGAKLHKGLIVTHTKEWAKDLQKQGIDATVYSDPKIWTYDGPVLMDLPAMFEFTRAQAKLANCAQQLLEFMDTKGID